VSPAETYLRPVFCWLKEARMPASTNRKYRPETQLVHAGVLRSQFGETSEALFLTQGYVYESALSAERRFKNEEPGYQYSRFANPTVHMFEQRMCALEGAEAARATATGMAAVTTALMGQVRAGDHVVASKALFGSCLYVVEDHLPRYGVTSTLVDGTDLEQWRKAVRPNTKTFFLESPTNPALEVLDIKAIADIAHAAGATLVVDNVFSTPLYQKPLQLGADCVVYSATKHIDGQGRCLGGVILASQKFIQDNVHNLIRQTGPSISPFNAWVLLKGLETLAVRVQRQTDTAATVAVALAEHPKISRLIYPGRPDHPQADVVHKQMRGGSTLVAFEIKGGKAAAFRFQDALKLVRISNNLGDAKSLITHPATTTHQRLTPAARAALGISDGLVRLSCGLEHPDDVVEDLVTALETA
jgi:O-succinylhomoserine sulfhydrylase